ncbi:hypothetical protein KM176_20975 [Pseudooceanicola sp. CBS1P-1]|uniref:Uncharacterized protein n=1 Tax=Pseudooceanicola albus TaxID=2692189 RepID=A0A6L7GAC5_9RHOB|nr:MULTISPECIES: hypothetical protein [Pseudooceanicola]MBT9386354.1 hypothetical protein [Pseudooceanicola endophyticus]MXN20488.1 hypothetical protein [Pseudooceanicola albus]
MPVLQHYDARLRVLVARAEGHVTEAELDAARESAAEVHRTAPVDLIFFDLRRVSDYPDIYPRAQSLLARLEARYAPLDRTVTLLICASYGSLGYCIGRVYLSASGAHGHVTVRLVESFAEACGVSGGVACQPLSPCLNPVLTRIGLAGTSGRMGDCIHCDPSARA